MNRKIEKLNGRDMINIGIYAAIYFVIAMALAFTGLIPEFYEGEREGSIRIGGQEAGGISMILLDESFAKLDFESTEGLREIIREWKSRGKTILLAEHRNHYVWELADKVVIPKGKATAIVGSNGAGKTTFLECLCDGVIQMEGKN